MVLDEGGQLASEMPLKDKAKYISGRLREIANEKGMELKLRKKRKITNNKTILNGKHLRI